MGTGWDAAGLVDLLRRLNAAGTEEVLPLLRDELVRQGGAHRLRLLMADVTEQVLNVWGEATHDRPGPFRHVQIDGTEHGQVYLRGDVVRTEVEARPAVLAPVTVRGERIGVVEVVLDRPVDDHAVRAATIVGLLLGYFITAADHWTDDFQVIRRRRDMSLAAEVQWNQLPLAAFSADGVSLAAALEPAYDIGGDTFDYAHGSDRLTIGIFDSMGHGLTAARASSLAVSAFRNARRRGSHLEDQARLLDATMRDLTEWGGFVTGQIVVIDANEPGKSHIVNAGHPPPFLQRGSSPPVQLELHADFPFGVPFPNDLVIQDLSLEPGDRLTLYSDGLTEARPDKGQVFGEAGVSARLESFRSLPPREAARRLILSVLDHRSDELEDDATVVIVDLLHGAT